MKAPEYLITNTLQFAKPSIDAEKRQKLADQLPFGVTAERVAGQPLMPVRKRSLKRRGALDADEEAWLRGDPNCGFVEFMPTERLEAFWDAFGDHDAFVWRRGMDRPNPTSIAKD